MRKYLVIFAVLLGLALYVAIKDKQASQDAAQKTAHQDNTVLPGKSNADHTQEHIEDAERNHPSWYSFFRWPYGTTAWAIILTLFAIAEQTKHTAEAADATRQSVGAIRQQTALLARSVDAAQKSADAADMSAKAAMGVAVPTLMLNGFAFAAQPGESASDFFAHPRVILIAKNFGQSPAFLKGYTITFTCNDLPDEPVYQFPYPCNAETVVDSGKTFLLDTDTLTIDKPMPDSDVLALVSGKKCLTVYGYISYGDIFGSPIRYMKFSKRLVEFDSDPKNMLVMDHGGYKYTGQHENYDPPQNPN